MYEHFSIQLTRFALFPRISYNEHFYEISSLREAVTEL